MLLLEEIRVVLRRLLKMRRIEEFWWGVAALLQFLMNIVLDSKEILKKIEILSSEIEKAFCESRFSS